MLNRNYIKEKSAETNSATQEFNAHHKELVQGGDVECIDESIPKSEYEKKTRRWFLEKNQKL